MRPRRPVEARPVHTPVTVRSVLGHTCVTACVGAIAGLPSPVRAV
ncbi:MULTISPECIES: twin-arginine translocation signal domain-containing protein [unclassified Streptomyces]